MSLQADVAICVFSNVVLNVSALSTREPATVLYWYYDIAQKRWNGSCSGTGGNLTAVVRPPVLLLQLFA